MSKTCKNSASHTFEIKADQKYLAGVINHMDQEQPRPYDPRFRKACWLSYSSLARLTKLNKNYKLKKATLWLE